VHQLSNFSSDIATWTYALLGGAPLAQLGGSGYMLGERASTEAKTCDRHMGKHVLGTRRSFV
jgi:hypothetical protein